MELDRYSTQQGTRGRRHDKEVGIAVLTFLWPQGRWRNDGKAEERNKALPGWEGWAANKGDVCGHGYHPGK